MKVKICGLTSVDAVKAATDAGADAVGFVFAVSSRQLSLEAVLPLLNVVPTGVETIAVFRHPTAELLQGVIGLQFDTVQASWDWSCEPLPDSVRFLPMFADGPELEARVEQWVKTAEHPMSRLGPLLIDGAGGGGRGERGSVDRAAAVAARFPVVLAGGLSPENVADAIRAVRPVAVDVCSGVEASPGVKDLRRVADFVTLARRALEDG
jgi:phosphoribosylanthranilate isomerase